MKCLNSTSTTPNGFPIIPVDTPYSGTSDYLVTDATTYDNNPYTTLWTSGSAVRLIAGQQYITSSVSEFFKAAFAMYGLALMLDGNELRLEPLSSVYDKDTMILDLQENVSEFQDMPFNDYAANNIRAGYKTQFQDFAQYVGNETSYFGLDVFNVQQDYTLPITRNKQDLDWTAPVVTDPYKIELARAASNSNGGSSPSASNDNYLIETTGEVVATPNVPAPNGSPVSVSAFGLLTYHTIQDTDPTTAPYARGLTFPDSMYNLGLTPARCMWRKQGMLGAICGTLQDSVVAFQKQYWQLYNGNTSIDVSGIASRLSADGLITEVADIPISDTTDRLFMPYIFKVTTEQPLNMYHIINGNPYGYIQFTWQRPSGQKTVYKGFILTVKQKIGNQMATEFELIAHPDTVI